jgi:NAD(P)-dependent dehydrogenase (short-subunit alcohol dehydrogenase family)
MRGQDGSALVVWITGASRGVGAATARMLSEQAGARIIVNYRDKRRRAESRGRHHGRRWSGAIQADLTKPEELTDAGDRPTPGAGSTS